MKIPALPTITSRITRSRVRPLRGRGVPFQVITMDTSFSEGHQIFCGNERVPTQVLCDDVLLNIIHPNSASLHVADPRCHLDLMLYAMLKHAPHPLGQRYIALCLLRAHQKGENAVVQVAKTWLDNLFLPMLAISKAIKTEPTLGEVLTSVETMEPEPISILSSVKQLTPSPPVAPRERYYCVITNVFDRIHAWKLSAEGRKEEIPPGVGQHHMAAAHIIPFLLNNFDVNATGGPLLKNAALTWDMLQSWTQIDFRTLVGSTINSPANTIYMTTEEHESFGNFDFYFDKEAYPDVPNKYKVRRCRPISYFFSNGQSDVDVQFPTLEQSGIEPPNPDYLKVHAAFAKVLNLCGAVMYGYRVESEAEMDGTLQPNGEMDFASKFLSTLAIIA